MFGAGEKSRFLPMHILFQKLGPSLCKVIFKARVLSGCDVTSKLGTKQASLNAKPDVYIRQFGEDTQLTIDEMKNAETYLIKLLQPKSLCTSCDQLRFEMYRTRKIWLIDLPPSSHCLKGNIQRCHYVVRQGICLLQESPEMDPCDFGWTETHGYFLPEKHLFPLPAHFLVRCGCNEECTGRCTCVRNDTNCTEFCKYKKHCDNYWDWTLLCTAWLIFVLLWPNHTLVTKLSDFTLTFINNWNSCSIFLMSTFLCKNVHILDLTANLEIINSFSLIFRLFFVFHATNCLVPTKWGQAIWVK